MGRIPTTGPPPPATARPAHIRPSRARAGPPQSCEGQAVPLKPPAVPAPARPGRTAVSTESGGLGCSSWRFDLLYIIQEVCALPLLAFECLGQSVLEISPFGLVLVGKLSRGFAAGSGRPPALVLLHPRSQHPRPPLPGSARLVRGERLPAGVLVGLPAPADPGNRGRGATVGPPPPGWCPRAGCSVSERQPPSTVSVRDSDGRSRELPLPGKAKSVSHLGAAFPPPHARGGRRRETSGKFPEVPAPARVGRTLPDQHRPHGLGRGAASSRRST
jgi:hypothetical protein